MVFSLVSCNGNGGATSDSSKIDQTNSVTPAPTSTSTTSTSTDPAPVEASTFDTNISTAGLDADQDMEVQKASEIIKLVVSSQEFKDRVLNHTVNGVKTFLNNNGLTNEQIYQKILEAAENDNLTKNNVMDLAFELIPQKTTSRIYRIISGIKKIFFFLNLFSNTTPAGIAQNLFQQWLGKMGFSLVEGSSSNLTVQQGIAAIIGELGKKYL
ncbi:MAG: hypothetical protein AB7I27_03485 [Bacteriovoracaceae bacterium]